MKIYNCIEDKDSRNIIIEGNSVNAVLLDTDPQDSHERLQFVLFLTLK